jgi:hypothetical protein
MEPFHLLVAIISPLKSTIAGDRLIQVLNTQRYLMMLNLAQKLFVLPQI